MDDKQKKAGVIQRILILCAVVIAIIAVFHFTPLSISDFTPERIKTFIQQFGVMAPLIFILIYSLRALILVLPVGVMSLAGGLAFGKWWGTLFILIGATLGACASFLMARYLGRGFIERLGVLKKGRLKTFDEGVEKNGFRFILFVRLIPLFQYDAVNFGAGLSKMRFRDYAIGSLIGMIPGGFINAMLGSSLDNIISFQFFIALGCFVLLMFIPAIFNLIKKRRQKRASTTDSADPSSAKEQKTTEESGQGRTISEKDKKQKRKSGICPTCGKRMGMGVTLFSWTTFGSFICPGCGQRIRFHYWFVTVFFLMGCFVGIERLLRWLIVTQLPQDFWLTDWVARWGRLSLSLLVSFLLAVAVMILVPRIWKFKAQP